MHSMESPNATLLQQQLAENAIDGSASIMLSSKPSTYTLQYYRYRQVDWILGFQPDLKRLLESSRLAQTRICYSQDGLHN